MPVTVNRMEPAHVASRDGLHTLEQRFRFDSASARAISLMLAQKPLIGDASVFGKRPGREEPVPEGRLLRGFSPAPTFRFDVALREVEANVFLVTFSQPDRVTPYLAGDLVWTLSDDGDAAVFDEQINTTSAMQHGRQPLGGAGWSFRRWLFFRIGHHQVMDGAMKNIAALL
jgi:hypothetical protein